MFTNISWLQYLMVAAPVICCYYLYVAVKYYRTAIQELLRRKENEVDSSDHEPEELKESPDAAQVSRQQNTPPTTGEDQEDQFDQIEQLVGEVKTRIRQAAGENLVKGMLEIELKEIIRKYPGLKNTLYRSAINELILYEYAEHNLATLSETDVEGLW